MLRISRRVMEAPALALHCSLNPGPLLVPRPVAEPRWRPKYVQAGVLFLNIYGVELYAS